MTVIDQHMAADRAAWDGLRIMTTMVKFKLKG